MEGSAREGVCVLPPIGYYIAQWFSSFWFLEWNSSFFFLLLEGSVDPMYIRKIDRASTALLKRGGWFWRADNLASLPFPPHAF